jgi:hypothetical protein
MLPASYYTIWGSGALYAELYLGMCRALAAPWLGPWPPDSRSGARPSPLAQPVVPSAASAAGAPAAAPEPTCQPQSCGALIIPFDRARARHAGQR